MNRRQPPRIIDQPEPCFIRMRVERKGPWLAARIFRTLGMLGAEINGFPADPLQVWASGDQISEAEYHTLLRVTNEPKPF